MGAWNEGLTDAEWIFLYGKRAKRKGGPVYLRREQRPGWSAMLPLYLFWCDRCDEFTVTHPAGYGRIHCKNRRGGCQRVERVMTWHRFRDHYVPFIVPILFFALLFALLFSLR